MPELPDLQIYVDAIGQRAIGHNLLRVQVNNLFLLRSVTPPLSEFENRRLESLSLLGKRVVFGFEGEMYLVIHLMIAGRFKWQSGTGEVSRRTGLAALCFDEGTLILTEAGKKRRASLVAVQGRGSLEALDRGGLSVLECTEEQFVDRLTATRHTVKRALCDPTLFAGIGNAYSDEILNAARLSPFKRTRDLTRSEAATIFRSARDTLAEWIERLRQDTGDSFPKRVTAFRPDMAVHGKAGQPCPACGTSVQRIVYADNETNYCPGCQTGGKLLKDRGLSRLLKQDWPRSVEELEDLPTRADGPSDRP